LFTRKLWVEYDKVVGKEDGSVERYVLPIVVLWPIWALILAALSLWNQGDGREKVSPDQLVEREGIVYKVGATEPYHGYSLLTDGNDVLTERWYYSGGYVVHKQAYTKGEEKGLRQIYFFDCVLSQGCRGSDQVKESGHYEDGQKEGNWQEFHRNGQVASKVTYRRGCYVGREERYHENGRLAERGNYADRPDCVGPELWRHSYHREGVWEYFDEEGVLEKTETRRLPGEFLYLEENYDRSGALISKGPKINSIPKIGSKDGFWEYFNEDGDLTKTETYKNEELVE